MKRIEKSIELGGRKLTLKTGGFAEQASASVMAQYGETVVLATVVSAPLKQDLGYFPLSVEYQERLYAGGRIKGSRWVKREGRPSDDEILIGRLIDRSIRPLFPNTYKKDVQVMITVLSVDLENSPDCLSAIATSSALAISSIPWQGPIGVVKVGMKDKKFFTNPLDSESSTSDMELVVSATKEAVIMVECASKEVVEEDMAEGISYAQEEAKKVIGLIDKLVKEAGKKKEVVLSETEDKNLEKSVKKLSQDKIEDLIKRTALKSEGLLSYEELKAAIVSNFEAEDARKAGGIFDRLFKKKVREMLLSGKRPDARKLDEIRPLSSMVGILPRTHGSALFQRGQTQVLTVTTLGAPSLEQLIESAEGEETKKFIHHYSMPPFSTGETGRVGFPSRREIGHGALAERALIPVVPPEDKFPYTIRVVSETLSSNGSTSMASVCASTLSLMDAGVPITAPVSGIAMGLVIESAEKYSILTDIIGLEDFNGDMDFKVAGTKKGITALQLDVKTTNLTPKIIKEALEQAKLARLEILDAMLKVIDKHRESVSKYAPKIKVIKIAPEKIGELIGPGGRIIRKIIAETGVQIDVDDDGTIFVSSATEEELKIGLSRVEAITKDPQVGEVYEGVVRRLQPFGAFIEILPGKEGLVHVSDISEEFVKDPSDVLKVGDKVTVRIKGIDDLGRLNFSMVLDPSYDAKKEGIRREKSMRGDVRRGKPERRQTGFTRRLSGSKGPHFPTSRLLERDQTRHR